MSAESPRVDAASLGDDASARRVMLANVRHELRTPINAILGYGEMLLEEAPEGDDAIPDLRRILEAGKSLLRMINDLLDSERVEAALQHEEASVFGARVRHELRTPLNAVIGYSEMLLEDGAGDSEERCADLRRVHEAGRRLLGLVDQLVRFAKDEGAATTPLAPMIHGVAQAISTPTPKAPSGTFEPGRLLVVDDNETNRDVLARRLRRGGHQVAVAENGRQALESIERESFDLVLLDIMMPEMNGFEVLGHLKSDERYRDIPVIVISALDELDSVVRCIEMGAEDHLSKPFEPTLLAARVSACLEKKRFRDRETVYLAQIEQERKRADDLLRVILPAEVADELKAHDVVPPRRYEDVAVLFCDIVGFTSYCDRHSAEEVVSNLQQLVEAYEELALELGLQKIKTIGDAFMAAAGLLRPVDDPVRPCVECGVGMIDIAQRLPAKWTVRIGIHVGPVVAGVLGRRQFLFDLWGDTVNTAARMESHGVPAAVTLSGHAWKRIADQAVGRSMGFVDVKGKGRLEMVQFESFLP